ncbi:hypothetical protein ISS05_05610, partial [Candidatus Woesearchaeota archaeon]|nr:hypothetical protein [Candidatus Woesearchaeota archaeon]
MGSLLRQNRKNLIQIFCLGLIFLIGFSYESYAYAVYANETQQHDITTASPFFLSLSANVSVSNNINHSFEARGVGGTAVFNVEYVAGNFTGFILKFLIDNANDRIAAYQCDGGAPLENLCSGGCGGNDFIIFHNFTVLFDGSNANVLIDGNFVGSTNICPGINEIGSVKFIGSSSLSRVKNNLLIATPGNNAPQFAGNLPNQIWPEDTSIGFNISGNFSDPDNDALTYSLESNVDNITITVDSNSGIVNLTPDSDFFGVRYVRFVADDGSNVIFSNNLTLNVIGVNDLPEVIDVALSNTDFFNRTNGSLIAGWIFSDKDNDVIQGNEVRWYNNSEEVIGLRNLTS